VSELLLRSLYRPSLTMLTDLYELTMAEAAFSSGAAARETLFHLMFRSAPFGSGFTLAAGLEQALEAIEGFGFEEDDLAYLRTLQGDDGVRLFTDPFLQFLAKLRPEVEVEAVPEGTVVFPQEPLLRVRGPVIPCMLLERHCWLW
jgi:nicotinate phosphoribosyltransferase